MGRRGGEVEMVLKERSKVKKSRGSKKLLLRHASITPNAFRKGVSLHVKAVFETLRPES